LILVLVLSPLPGVGAATSMAGTAGSGSGGQAAPSPWRQLAAPDKAGWSPDRLAEARAFAEKIGSDAVMAVHDGRVVAAWGDVLRRFELYSARKSLVSGLAGIVVADGRLDTSKTLAELGIDDAPPLLDSEKQAKVIDLLRSRSGIYHPAAKETADMKTNRPARGSAAPGATWLYNNWDFNMVGVLLERAAGRGLFEEFESRIAAPLSMEDFRARDGYEQFERNLSRFPAHAFRMSARDLARFGWMFARGGAWEGRQVVPKDWVAESTRVHSEVRPGTGYGLMWWVYPKGGLEAYPALDAYDKFAASGNYGQFVLVVPGADFVFVHLAASDDERGVGGRDIWRLAEMVLSARTAAAAGAAAAAGRAGAGAAAGAETKPLEPVPFPGASPAPPEPEEIALAPEALAAFVGEYEAGPGRVFAITLAGDRLVAAAPGFPEIDLWPDSPVSFFAKAAPVRVRFERDAAGRVAGLVLSYRGQDLAARRKT
jgi:CubicO group peptidase (beta-lactamase class C family)